MTTDDYFQTGETTRRQELRWGSVVREPAAPFWPHQRLVLNVARLLCDHVDPGRLGFVAVAPVDVVLDREQGLVVQPDVLFVSAERASIIANQVWGAPDLVVEVLSPATERQDRVAKLDWYRRYGVREYWLIELPATVSVIDYSQAIPAERVATGNEIIRSTVFPELRLTASAIFP